MRTLQSQAVDFHSLLLPGSYGDNRAQNRLGSPCTALIDMQRERDVIWDKRRTGRIARQYQLHLDTAFELCQARQQARTVSLANRTLRCFAWRHTSGQWVNQALPLVPLLSEAHLHRTSLELLQRITSADMSLDPCSCTDTHGSCLSCITDPTRSHNYTHRPCSHWRRRRAQLADRAWSSDYAWAGVLLRVHDDSPTNWDLLYGLEQWDSAVFKIVVAALHCYYDALDLPPELSQYGITAVDELVQAAAAVQRSDRHQADERSTCDRIYFAQRWRLVEVLLQLALSLYNWVESIPGLGDGDLSSGLTAVNQLQERFDEIYGRFLQVVAADHPALA